MACSATFKAFDKNGESVGAGSILLPEYLDWLPIAVKAHWYRRMGHGPEKSHYVLLTSQGEQLLIVNVSLQPLNYTSYKERVNGNVRNEVEDFIEKGGYSRVPRNQ